MEDYLTGNIPVRAVPIYHYSRWYMSSLERIWFQRGYFICHHKIFYIMTEPYIVEMVYPDMSRFSLLRESRTMGLAPTIEKRVGLLWNVLSESIIWRTRHRGCVGTGQIILGAIYKRLINLRRVIPTLALNQINSNHDGISAIETPSLTGIEWPTSSSMPPPTEVWGTSVLATIFSYTSTGVKYSGVYRQA